MGLIPEELTDLYRRPPAPEMAPLSRDEDLAVRTIIGEAKGEGEVGWKAVAGTIRNRSKGSGKGFADVVLAPNQFEPWGSRRKELEGYDPNSSVYQKVAAASLPVLRGEEADPTGGATHFYSPTTQAALGRRPPSWDNGKGKDIGRHRFFNLGYTGKGIHGTEPSSGPGPGAARSFKTIDDAVEAYDDQSTVSSSPSSLDDVVGMYAESPATDIKGGIPDLQNVDKHNKDLAIYEANAAYATSEADLAEQQLQQLNADIGRQGFAATGAQEIQRAGLNTAIRSKREEAIKWTDAATRLQERPPDFSQLDAKGGAPVSPTFPNNGMPQAPDIPPVDIAGNLGELRKKLEADLANAPNPTQKKIIEEAIARLDIQIGELKKKSGQQTMPPAVDDVLKPYTTDHPTLAESPSEPYSSELAFDNGEKLTQVSGQRYRDKHGDEYDVTATAADKGFSYALKPASPFTKEIKLTDGKTLVRQDDDAEQNPSKRRYIDDATGDEYLYDGKEVTREGQAARTAKTRTGRRRAVIAQPQAGPPSRKTISTPTPGGGSFTARVDPDFATNASDKNEGVFRQAIQQWGTERTGKPLNRLQEEALVDYQKSQRGGFVFSLDKPGEAIEGFKGEYVINAENAAEYQAILDRVQPEIEKIQIDEIAKKIISTTPLTPEEIAQMGELYGVTPEQLEAAYSTDPRFTEARAKMAENIQKRDAFIKDLVDGPAQSSPELAYVRGLHHIGVASQEQVNRAYAREREARAEVEAQLKDPAWYQSLFNTFPDALDEMKETIAAPFKRAADKKAAMEASGGGNAGIVLPFLYSLWENAPREFRTISHPDMVKRRDEAVKAALRAKELEFGSLPSYQDFLRAEEAKGGMAGRHVAQFGRNLLKNLGEIPKSISTIDATLEDIKPLGLTIPADYIPNLRNVANVMRYVGSTLTGEPVDWETADTPVEMRKMFSLGKYIQEVAGDDRYLANTFAGEMNSALASGVIFLAGGSALKGTKYGLPALGAVMQIGSTYEQLRAAGASEADARKWGTVIGAVSGYSEKWGLGGTAQRAFARLGSEISEDSTKILLKSLIDFTRNPVTSAIKRETVEEGLQEWGQSAFTEAAVKAISKKNATDGEKVLAFLDDLPRVIGANTKQAAIGGLTGAVLGGGTQAAMSAAKAVKDRRAAGSGSLVTHALAAEDGLATPRVPGSPEVAKTGESDQQISAEEIENLRQRAIESIHKPDRTLWGKVLGQTEDQVDFTEFVKSDDGGIEEVDSGADSREEALARINQRYDNWLAQVPKQVETTPAAKPAPSGDDMLSRIEALYENGYIADSDVKALLDGIDRKPELVAQQLDAVEARIARESGSEADSKEGAVGSEISNLKMEGPEIAPTSQRSRANTLSAEPFETSRAAQKTAKESPKPAKSNLVAESTRAAAQPSPGPTRSWRAGMNQAEITFASAEQRDLYDFAANESYKTKGGRNKAGQRPVKQIAGALAARLGIGPDEIYRRSKDVYDDIKAQMRGIGDGESRAVVDNVTPSSAKAPATKEQFTDAGKLSQNDTDWFKGSKITNARGKPLVVHHGTNQTFDKFEQRETYRNIDGRSEKVMPQAFYFSTDPESAKIFAKDKVLIDQRLRGLEGGKPEVRDYILRAENPLDLTITPEARGQLEDEGFSPLYNPDAVNPIAARIFEDAGYGLPEDWADVQQLLDDPGMVRDLRNQGYDAVKLRENDGSESYAVFDPAQIRPAMRGNEAASDDRVPDLDEAANEAATSPRNDLPEPTQAQKEAGNYKKGHIVINGLDISIENPAGSKRTGTNREGKKWSVTMRQHYGYIKRTVGADEEQIDTFVADGTTANFDDDVYVIDQISPDTGKFDEHKVMLGFPDEASARSGYLINYDRNWKGLGAITTMPMDDFKAWVRNGVQDKPVKYSEQATDNTEKNEDAATKVAAVLETTEKPTAQINEAAAPTTIEPGGEQRPGDVYKGKTYRVESNLIGGGKTALDIVNFEAEELGNTDTREQALAAAKQHDVDLATVSAKDVVWVTDSKEAAEKYLTREADQTPIGEVEEVEIPKGSIILAADGENGYLVLTADVGKKSEKLPLSEKRVEETPKNEHIVEANKKPYEMTREEYDAAFPKEADGQTIAAADGYRYEINEGVGGKWWAKNLDTEAVKAFRNRADMREFLYGHASHHKAVGRALREGEEIEPSILAGYPQLERIANKRRADRIFKFQSDERASEILRGVATEGKTAQGIEEQLAELPAIAETYHVTKAEVDRLVATADTGYRRRQSRDGKVPEEGSRPPTGKVLEGKDTLIRIPGEKTTYSARYVVREADDTQPSHNPFNFNPNPEYWYTNDRHYDKQKGYQASVVEDSQPNNFQPEQVVNNAPTAEIGPPVIDMDGNDLGGNSRLMKILRIYASENAKARNAYVAKIRDEAAAFGIDGDQLSKFERPVLVREITQKGIDKQQAITDFNKVSAKDLSQAEAAVAGGTNISDEALAAIADAMDRTGSNANVTEMMNAHGPEIVQALIDDGVFNENQRNTLVQEGKATEAAKTRVKQLLLGKVFDDLEQMQLVPARIQGSIERAIVPLIKTQRDASWDILPEVREAVDLLTEHAAKGGKESIDNFTRQESLVRPQGWNARAVTLAKALKSGDAAPFKIYAGEFRNAEVGSMFGELSPEEAFRTAFETERAALRSRGSQSPPFSLKFDYQDGLKRFEKGTMRPHEALRMTATPAILERLGIKNRDVVITQKVLAKVLNERHRDEIGLDTLQRLPAEMHDPVIVFDYKNDRTGLPGFTFITSLRGKNGRPVAVGMAMDTEFQGYTVHSVLTVHERTYEDGFIDRMNEGKLRYVNKQKSQALFPSFSLQVATAETKPGQLKNLLTEADFVKKPLRSVGARGMAATAAPVVGREALKNWFGDSKVVNENGEPLKVYHGTARAFDEFSSEARPANYSRDSGKGFFFTAESGIASDYANHSKRMDRKMAGLLHEEPSTIGPNVVPVYLRIENPKIVDYRGRKHQPADIARRIESAKKAGYDGLFIEDIDDNLYADGSPSTLYIAFDSKQIKSAIGNQGTFDPNDPSILRQVRTDEAADELHHVLPFTHLADVLDKATGGSISEAGELHLTPADAEIVRRLHGAVAMEREGREIHEPTFNGVVLDAATLRDMASAGRWSAEEIRSMGYPDKHVERMEEIAGKVDELAVRARDYGIAYVFDEALPEERFHQKDLRAGRTDLEAEERIEAESTIYQHPGDLFNEQYGGESRADKISEVIAKLATGQEAKYGWDRMPDFERESAKIRKLWADGVIRKNLDAEGNLNPDIINFSEVFNYAYNQASKKGRGEAAEDNPSGGLADEEGLGGSPQAADGQGDTGDGRSGPQEDRHDAGGAIRDEQSRPEDEEGSEEVKPARQKTRKTVLSAEKYGVIETGGITGTPRYYTVKSTEARVARAQDKIERMGIERAAQAALIPVTDLRYADEQTTFQWETVHLLNDLALKAETEGSNALAAGYIAQKQAVLEILAMQGTPAGRLVQSYDRVRRDDARTVTEYVERRRKRFDYNTPLDTDEKIQLKESAIALALEHEKVLALQQRIEDLETKSGGSRKLNRGQRTLIKVLTDNAIAASQRLKLVSPVLRSIGPETILRSAENAPHVSLEAQVMEDLSDVGAAILFNGFYDEDVITPAEFEAEFNRQTGGVYAGHWKSVHAHSMEKLSSLRAEMRRQNAYDRVRAAHPDLTDDVQIRAKLGEELYREKERQAVRREHRKMAADVLKAEGHFTERQKASLLKEYERGREKEVEKKLLDKQKTQDFLETAAKLSPNAATEVLAGAALIDRNPSTGASETAFQMRQMFPDLKTDRDTPDAGRASRLEELNTILAQAKKLVDRVHAEKRREAEAARGQTQEAKDALAQAKSARRDAQHSFDELVTSLEKPPLSRSQKAALLQRQMMVSAINTAANNMVSGVATRGQFRIVDAIDVGIQKAAKHLGTELKNEGLTADTRWADVLGYPAGNTAGFKTYLRQVASAHSTILKAIDEHPDLFNQLYGDYSSDIENVDAIKKSKGGVIHKALDAGLYVFDKASFANRWQEYFVRDLEALYILQTRLGQRGLNLADLEKDGQLDQITADDWQHAIQRARQVTFALKPERGTAADKVLTALNNHPIPSVIVAPFAKFSWNVWNMTRDWLPGIAQVRAMRRVTREEDAGVLDLFNPAKYTSREMANSLAGFVFLMTAYGLVRALGDRDDWYYLKIPYSDGMGRKSVKHLEGSPLYIDMRQHPEFAPFLYLANKLNRLVEGRDLFNYDDPKAVAGELGEVFLSLSYRQAIDQNSLIQSAGHGVSAAIFSADREKDSEKAWYLLSRFAGERLGMALSPFRPVKNVVDSLVAKGDLDLDKYPFTQGFERQLPSVILQKIGNFETKKNAVTGEEKKHNPYSWLKPVGLSVVDEQIAEPKMSQTLRTAKKLAFDEPYTPPITAAEKKVRDVKRDIYSEMEKLRQQEPAGMEQDAKATSPHYKPIVDAIDKAVSDGILSESQADRIKKTIGKSELAGTVSHENKVANILKIYSASLTDKQLSDQDRQELKREVEGKLSRSKTLTADENVQAMGMGLRFVPKQPPKGTVATGDGAKPEERRFKDDKSFIGRISTYADAIGADPVDTFKKWYAGETIRRTDNGTIIVERMDKDASQAIKRSRGSQSDMRLDHVVPLELGGDNSESNLKLVTREEWARYTPVENALGRALRSGRIDGARARELMSKFKRGWIGEADINREIGSRVPIPQPERAAGFLSDGRASMKPEHITEPINFPFGRIRHPLTRGRQSQNVIDYRRGSVLDALKNAGKLEEVSAAVDKIPTLSSIERREASEIIETELENLKDAPASVEVFREAQALWKRARKVLSDAMFQDWQNGENRKNGSR